MTGKNPEVKIYAPPRFKATWRKFLEICEREGVSASHLVRVWVEGYVARKDPGNPQRPLTAFVEGHEDEVKASWSKTVQELIARAEHLGGELSYTEILDAYKARGVTGPRLVARAQSMARALEKIGIKVWY